MTTKNAGEIVTGYKYGWNDPEFKPVNVVKKGLNREVVAQISEMKNEPQWMRDFRLRALEIFESKPMEGRGKSWDEVQDEIKRTFDKLGIPEAERKFLAGVGAQYGSEVVYHKIREDLEKQGVQFLDMDGGLREHEDVVRQYFGTIVPAADN